MGVVILVLCILCVILLGFFVLFVYKLLTASGLLKPKTNILETDKGSGNGENKFVCQRDYRNYAWGYQHNGMYVDSDGNVYRYKEEENKNDPYKQPTEEKTFDDLDVNRGEKTFVRKLTNEELEQMQTLFEEARDEDMGLGKQTGYGNDGGVTSYNCYEQKDNQLKVYKLLQFGDEAFDSAGKKGQKLGDWLKNLFHPQDE